jgi:hypothetical protein
VKPRESAETPRRGCRRGLIVAIEIIAGAVGALASLAAGLAKTIAKSPEKNSDEVTVTVQRSDGRIEERGILRPEDASRILEMVKEESRTASAK